ncbi:Hsp20/alpha crystallin family protein [Ostertagia ostertagi]
MNLWWTALIACWTSCSADWTYSLRRDMAWAGRHVMLFSVGTNHSTFHMENQTKELVNDDKKFAVVMDVSQLRLDDLKVQVEGHNLLIHGHGEMKTDHGHIRKSFVSRWTLPKDCDLDVAYSQIDNDGNLSIEIPKNGHDNNT